MARFRFLSRLRAALFAAFGAAGLLASLRVVPVGATSDLDDFMARVIARRDENWKTLQQYVLDERETAEVVGPARTRLFALDRQYTWYIRDGSFVRSPLRFDGVTLSEADRREYERRWLERERSRERGATSGSDAPDRRAGHEVDDPASLATLVREPQFVTAAYFLKFRFEPGRYALVGHESHEGVDVLRVEYYPVRLFADDEGEREGADDEAEARLERQMNKVSLVTLWVEPAVAQVVKYTFDNVGMDFLPGRWLVRLNGVQASMRMGQPFPGVWLPQAIEAHARISLASGPFDVRYNVRYDEYRLADVKATIR